MFKINKKQDFIFILIVFSLIALGLAILYSTSEYNGRVKFHDPAYYFKKQIFATALGMVAMYVISCIDYHFLAKFSAWIYIGSMLLSVAVLLWGEEYNGSKRWLSLGPLSFQPSEFAKVAVILFLAYQIGKSKRKKRGFAFILWVLILILPIVAFVGTNNLSTAIIIMGIAVILIFVSDSRYLQFIWIGGAGVGFVAIFLSMESYRLERLKIWKNPELYDKGFQTIQGLYAIGSGGFFGNGLGNSIQKLGFVPEAQNDMIFSIICEELGFVGAGLVILLFGILIWRLSKIAMKAKDLLGTLIAAGIMAHIALQVILNIAVVTNTIPNTGITLPFVSYGGTSVVFLLSEMGLALSVAAF